MRAVLAMMLVVCLTGCISTYYVPDPETVFTKSPAIERLTKDEYKQRTAADSIELYFYWWNPLTAPNAVQNWEYHFVMGKASSPAWDYTRISRVEHAQRFRDDDIALNALRNLASTQGGDALIDLRREVMIDGPRFGSGIIGYRYLATIVRKK